MQATTRPHFNDYAELGLQINGWALWYHLPLLFLYSATRASWACPALARAEPATGIGGAGLQGSIPGGGKVQPPADIACGKMIK